MQNSRFRLVCLRQSKGQKGGDKLKVVPMQNPYRIKDGTEVEGRKSIWNSVEGWQLFHTKLSIFKIITCIEQKGTLPNGCSNRKDKDKKKE